MGHPTKAIHRSTQESAPLEKVLKAPELAELPLRPDSSVSRRYSSVITIIVPSGMMDAESGAVLKEQLTSTMAAVTEPELIIDMSRVESLDNAGLVDLMQAINTARARTKSIYILRAPPSIQIVFELTQLDRVCMMIDSSLAASQLPQF
ncbi:STAS domain-containing protein [Leptolyngbya cf. ectocarpi LEGE 11479]|uniref:STAS domain-containing protein n=1 Tax=Leptolyngbya cf. ectocarpi LEGE 11479 TaxID=1828722 RepID=A0A928WZJ0_LEPEC|nr:STAS domain-containing protein [Leptolyngbya ectocarpi]MBE9066330.1 STAS domain-containing protein [Leptolyngbya cf. ectocarpi LEGE 11479]